MRNILILVTLIFGLIFTALIKNKTRLLEKELTQLNNEVTILNSYLDEATLDFEYLTTPKNVFFLAENLLDENFSFYQRKQIKNLLNSEENDLVNLDNAKKGNIFSKLKANKNLHFAKNSDVKRFMILEKNNEILEKNNERLFILKKEKNDNRKKESEKEINTKKVQRWAGIQIIKTLLGFPIVPIK